MLIKCLALCLAQIKCSISINYFGKTYSRIQKPSFMASWVVQSFLESIRERVGNSFKGNNTCDKIHLFVPINMKPTHGTSLGKVKGMNKGGGWSCLSTNTCSSQPASSKMTLGTGILCQLHAHEIRSCGGR